MAILNRWGASENTFKHMGDKHPLNYQPGYSFTESQNQEIANPEVKEIKTRASGIKAKLVACIKSYQRAKKRSIRMVAFGKTASAGMSFRKSRKRRLRLKS